MLSVLTFCFSCAFFGQSVVIATTRSCVITKVFVSNLAYEVGWQDLKDHMRQAGNVLHADVFTGNDGRSKGLATVEFSRPFEV